jgi:O-antigen ligase
LLLAAAGLALFGFAPLPLALVGVVLYAGAIGYRPSTCVPTTILALPFYLHPRSIFGLDLSAAELAILVGALSVLVAARWGDRWGAGPIRWPRPGVYDAAAAAFLAAALLSLLVTEYPKQSLRELRWLIVEPIVLGYIARVTLLPPAPVQRVLWSIVVAGALAAVISVASLAFEGQLFDSAARAAAPYLSANHLGLFLGRAAAVALAIALFTGPPIASPPPRLAVLQRPLAWAALAVIGVALVRSVSFGALIGSGAAVFALTARRGWRWLAALAVIFAVVALAGLVLLPPERTIGRFEGETGTGLFRIEIWRSSSRMIADHPVLGVGLDNFLYLYRSVYIEPEAWPEPNISHPHNWVLNFWLELGVLGLLAAVALIVWTARAAHRLFYNGGAPVTRVLAVAAIGVLIDTLVHGLFDNSYFLVDAAALWWVMTALLADAVEMLPRKVAPVAGTAARTSSTGMADEIG